MAEQNATDSIPSHIRQQIGGEVWAHWRYTPDEWQAYVQGKTGSLPASIPVWLGLALLAGFGVGFLFWFLVRSVPWALTVGGVLTVVLLPTQWLLAQRSIAREAVADPEAYIGPMGVYWLGEFQPLWGEWDNKKWRLDQVRLDTKAQSEIIFDRTATLLGVVDPQTRSRQDSFKSPMAILVPAASGNEAAVVVWRFKERLNLRT